FFVQQLRSCSSSLLHGFYATHFLNPFQILQHRENWKYWWCIEHGFFINVHFVVHHAWYLSAHFSQNFFVNDDHCNTCRSHVFLSSSVDDSKFTYIHFSA